MEKGNFISAAKPASTPPPMVPNRPPISSNRQWGAKTIAKELK